MATLIRSAKSANDWTLGDLSAYNIRIELQDAASFFGTAQLPDPIVNPDEILTKKDADEATTDQGFYFLSLLQKANRGPSSEEAIVDTFATKVFEVCGYVGRSNGRMYEVRKELPLYICGEERRAQTDVCIVDRSQILLLVQEDKRGSDEKSQAKNNVPQLIAEAIAAFSANNFTRSWVLHQPPLQSKIMPGITMEGTAVIFYKVPVTSELVDALRLGTYPEHETVVFAHVPVVPRAKDYAFEGMVPLDNRRIVFSCMEAFKQFVN